MEEMQDLLRKSMLAGIGILSFTRDKAEDLVNDLTRRGNMTREQAQGLVNDMVRLGETERKELNRSVQEQVRTTVEGMGLASKDEVHELLHRIEILEVRIAELSAKLESR
jgi:polyhydroxyalkanoate synthesis regulator phasin